MSDPSHRLDHYPRPTVDENGRHVVHCSCGKSFYGDDVQQAANGWGDHLEETRR